MRKTILQETRTWIKTASSLTDQQVILANQKGPRPSTDYVTVELPMFRVISTGEPTSTTTFEWACQGTLELVAIGREAFDWLYEAFKYTRTPVGYEFIKGLSFTPTIQFDLVFRPMLVDTAMEHRASWDIDFFCTDIITDEEGVLVAAESVTYESEEFDFTVPLS